MLVLAIVSSLCGLALAESTGQQLPESGDKRPHDKGGVGRKGKGESNEKGPGHRKSKPTAVQEPATPTSLIEETEVDDETRRIRRSVENLAQRSNGGGWRSRGYGNRGGGRSGGRGGYGGMNSNRRGNGGIVLLPIYGYGGR
uniref:Secreted protein n=1 Tax=Romanomermis culicivorax TaxID=13658 RepID=A0A915IUU3_ROMCU